MEEKEEKRGGWLQPPTPTPYPLPILRPDPAANEPSFSFFCG